MTITKAQLKSLVHGMPGKKRSRKKRTYYNHEVWRTCQRCGHEMDMRKERLWKCSQCGSKNLNKIKTQKIC